MSIVLRASARIVTLFLLFAVAALGRAAGPDFLVDAAWLEGRLEDPKTVVLEVRYHPHRYETVGHIPGAINVVSLDGTDPQSQKWLSLEEIAALYKDVPKDATIITYCHDGFRSALAWLQLKALGYRDVRFFNGGWRQWDHAMTLPVVQGDAPYDADFAL